MQLPRGCYMSRDRLTCTNMHCIRCLQLHVQIWNMIFIAPIHTGDVLQTYCVNITYYFSARKLRITIVHYVVCSHIRSDNRNRVQVRLSDNKGVRPENHRWGRGTFHLTSSLVNILISFLGRKLRVTIIRRVVCLHVQNTMHTLHGMTNTTCRKGLCISSAQNMVGTS